MKSNIVTFGLSLALLGGAWGVFAQPLPPGVVLKTGFPKTLSGSGSPTNEPVWANLGITGRKSIIVGTSSRELWVVNHDGNVAPGWPVFLPGEVHSSAAVADLDGDGIPEIVVGFGGGASDPVNVGGVRAFRRDGTVMWTRNGFNDLVSASQFPLGVVSTPAIGDIDGDGHVDVAWGSFDAHIYAVDGRTGLDKPGWPLFVRDTIWSSPVLYDLDGDGKLEVIIGTDSHADPSANPAGVPPTIDGGRLHVLNYFGKEMPGFPKDVDEVINSSPVVGDIDGDGRPEIIHGTGTYYSIVGGAASSKKLYAWKCDGSAVPNWPVPTTSRVIGSPALANLEGLGLDVIVSEYSPTAGQNVVAAYRGNGTKIWETVPLAYQTVNLNAGHPVVADVGLGAAGKVQILLPTNSEICILDNLGHQLTVSVPFTGAGYSLYMPGSASSATLDIDNGVLNIAAASQTGGNVLVYAWTVTGKSTPPVWGAFRFDARRLGFAPNAGACAPRPVVSTRFHPITPCRLLDTRNGTFPLGTALGPGERRDFNVTGLSCAPLGAVSISANVTVTGQNAPGDLTIFPPDVAQPISTVLSFPAFKTRGNNAIIYFSATGSRFSVYNNSAAPAHLILDVNGYFQ